MLNYCTISIISASIIFSNGNTLPPNKGQEFGEAKQVKDVSPLVQSAIIDAFKGFLGKPTANSQVLNLNLTNMVFLLALKGLLWTAAFLGPNKQKGGRNAESEPLISESDILLLVGYLIGDKNGDYECLYKFACENPNKTNEYIDAAHMILHSTEKFINGTKIRSNITSRYGELVDELQDASDFGTDGGPCDLKYTCGEERISF